ncbi:hypothetical protein [Streptomyces sp. 8N706]|uniref:hypothetical protein n=1 Tax=Streptomyces sp. 8N706 TaxID=3457416 RepID=UPI003FD63557
MEAAILILALLFVLFVALGAYVAVKVLSAAKRGVDRTVEQARRTVEDTTLRARKYTQPGAVGDLAELRLSLRTSMRSTQEALAAASPEDASLAESIGLFKRLSAHGHQLDDDLKRLEREPDKNRLLERLPELRERTEQVVRHADSLRWAVRDRTRRFAGDDLEELGRQIEVESGALRHWTTEETPFPQPSRQEATPRAGTPTRRSGAPTPTRSQTPASTPTPTWPDVSRPDAEAQEPPAITARDPRQAAYPWTKARRPESST